MANNINYLQNFDAIIKWLSNAFTGQTLEALGISTGKIVEVRGLEPITLSVKQERVDLLLKDEEGNFYHIEEERNLSRRDVARFAAQHFLISEQIKSDNLTTIIVASGQVTPLKQWATKSSSFAPVIINLEERNGEELLATMQKKEKINPVELAFLPMYGVKSKTKEEFAKDALVYAKDLYLNEKISLELLAATVIMSNKFIPLDVLKAIWEEVSVLQVFKHAETIGEEIGEAKKAREIAKEMLKENMSIEQISKMTKLSADEITQVKAELEKE